MTEKLSVAEAAKMLGWDVSFLRAGLQQNKYPFGVATKSPKAKRYAYKIYPKALQNFIYEKYGKEVTV